VCEERVERRGGFGHRGSGGLGGGPPSSCRGCCARIWRVAAGRTCRLLRILLRADGATRRGKARSTERRTRGPASEAAASAATAAPESEREGGVGVS
jgi:hypothetical protein